MRSSKAARGTLYLTVQQLIQYLAAFIFYGAVARLISQAEVGLWSVMTASTAVFSTFTLLGLPVAAQKYVSENYGRGDLGVAASISRLGFTVVAFSTLSTLAAVLLLSPSLPMLLLGTTEYTFPFILVLSTSAILNFTTLYGADMLGLGMYTQVAIQNLAFFLISRGSGLALAYGGYGLFGLAAGFLTGAFSCLILSIYFMWNQLPKPTKQIRDLCGTVFRYSYPVWFLAIVTLAQGWADIAILYALTGQPAVTGMYYLATAGATLLAVFWTAISTVILSLMSSEEARAGGQALPSIYNASSRLLNILILPIGAGLAAISPTAITFAYGRSYIGGASLFTLLMATALLPAYVSINTSTLQAVAQTEVLAKIGMASAVIDIALVIVLVKPFEANGAALARVGMHAATFFLTQKKLASVAQIKLDVRHVGKAIALAAVVASPLAVIDYVLTHLYPIDLLTRLMVEGFFFLVVYAISLRFLRVIEERDLELLRKAFPHPLGRILNAIEGFIIRGILP